MKSKFLVIRGGALGDFILTLPALAALRENFPASEIELIARPGYATLASAAGMGRCVHSIDSPQLAGLFAAEGSCSTEIADYLRKFDVILSYFYDPAKIFQTNVERRTRAQFIAGPHRPAEDGREHAADVLLRPLETLGIRNAPAIPSLRFARDASVFAPDEKWVAMHPGSGSEQKNWAADHWFSLCRRVCERTALNMLLICGEAEGERVARMCAGLPTGRVRLARDWPLVRLAQAMQECVAFVGHDSGITHLAAALGLRGVAIWRNTSETVWRPRGETIGIVRSRADGAQPEVDAVWEALREAAGLPLT